MDHYAGLWTRGLLFVPDLDFGSEGGSAERRL